MTVIFRILHPEWTRSSRCLVWEMSSTRDCTLTVSKGLFCCQETWNWLCASYGWFWI